LGAYNFGASGNSSANGSVNFGWYGLASNNYAYNFGYNGIANGYASINFGQNGASSGVSSYNFNDFGTASGDYSKNFAYNGASSGGASYNFGSSGNSNGYGSVNFGDGAATIGLFSINFGHTANVTGNNAINFSNQTNLNAFSSFQLGYNGVEFTSQSLSTDVQTDLLFKIDKGAGISNRRSSLIHLKSGLTQLRAGFDSGNESQNDATPVASLEVTSTQRGFIPPRLDASQFSVWQSSFNTTTDVTGLSGSGDEKHSRQGEMVFNLATTKMVIAVWNGSAWQFDNLN
jgi:hypothetical protein